MKPASTRPFDAMKLVHRWSLSHVQAVVRTLMKFGMRADVTDSSGKTALDVAVQRAKSHAQDPLVMYMTRTARIQNMQIQGLQRRRQESQGGGRPI
jgi:hypothetical protein